MEIIVFGASHKTAPIDVRDRLGFSAAVRAELVHHLRAGSAVAECALLCTCNRTECYLVAESVQAGAWSARDAFARASGLAPETLDQHCATLVATDTARHLFRVASSLESLVVGEPQVTGQVKAAHEEAMEQGTSGPVLNRLFAHSLALAKRSRTETSIGQGAVSVSFAAVELAKKIFSELQDRSVLVVGAGEMSKLVARHLAANGVAPSRILVASRTLARAAELADAIGGRAMEFGDTLNQMAACDIVISSTGAPRHLYSREDLRGVMRARRNAPIFLIDIAVPRDFAPEIGDLYNVFLYNLDDLEGVVGENRARRAEESRKVEALIEEGIDDFMDWWRSRRVVPVITSLRAKCEDIRQAELERLASRLGALDPEQRALVEGLTKSLLNKVLHDPVSRLKVAAASGDGLAQAESARYLFDLDEAAEAERDG